MKQKMKPNYDRNESSKQVLLLLELAFNLIFLLIIPFLKIGIQYLIRMKGLSYLTPQNIIPFLTYPPTILLIIITILLLSFFTLFKIITVIYYCSNKNTDNKFSFLFYLSNGFMKTLHCLHIRNIVLPFYSFFLYLFTNIPLLIGITVYLRLQSSGSSANAVFIKGLIILAILLIGFIAFRGIFTIHFCILNNQNFVDGITLSKQLLIGESKNILASLIKYNLILTLIALLLYYLLLFITAILTYIFVRKSMVIAFFLSLYPKINMIYILICSLFFFLINTNRINHSYHNLFEQKINHLHLYRSIIPNPPALHKNYKHLNIGFLVLILFSLFNVIIIIKNDSFYLEDAFIRTEITAHRGNSYVAPENTLPALENAIISRANYAEIDVQQSKDCVPVLMHDKSLWRTARINRTVHNLSYVELSKIDVGSYYGKEFTGTPIPTLEEALILCKDKIKLNIDIKIYGQEQKLEENIMDLINEYDFIDQCVITSSNYPTLQKVKELCPEIKTGYIMPAAYGNFYDNTVTIDFYSISSNYITKNIVEHAHKLGKEIHVWTVNSSDELERMKSLGVDNIITNNPTLAIKILYRDDTSDTFIQLLNRMLYHHSLFRLS